MKGFCLFSILSLWGLNACSYGLNAIPEDLKTGLSPGVVFKAVIRDPESSVGKKVLWGGVILKTTVYETRTIIEVLHKPLDRRERPLETDQSDGRFLVEQTGKFLDPAIYKAGREVTIIGDITKAVKKEIDEMVYHYPYVVASHIHLWHERAKTAGPIYYSSLGCRYSNWYGYRDPFDPLPAFYLNPYAYPYRIWPYRVPFIFRHHQHKNDRPKASDKGLQK